MAEDNGHSNGGDFTSRRSTRIATDVLVELQGEGFAYAGKTVTLNLHGALVHVSAPLKLENRVILHVHLTGKSAMASVVFVDEAASEFGIELDTPDNIWGVSVAPADWNMRTSDVPVEQT
jgi:nitrous oxidase accessory protein NosD